MILGNHDSRARSVLQIVAKFIHPLALLLAALLAAGPLPAQSSPPTVLPLVGPVDAAALTPHLEYIIDPDWQMSVSGLAAQDAAGWQPVPGATPDFGYTAARIWLRVGLRNDTVQTTDWRVFVQSNFWPTLQIWRIAADGTIDTLMDLQPDSPFGARPIDHPQQVAPLTLAPGETITLILSYSSQGSSRNAISIQTAESFAALTASATARTFTFYGMILALMAVTSIALVVLRQALHVVYALYVSSLFFYIAHIDGTTFQYLWPNWPGFNGMASVVAGAGAMVFGALFAVLYLQTRRFHPVMHRILLGAVATVLGLVAVLWSVDPQRLKQLMVLMISINALIILTAAVVAARQRFSEVKFYLLAWAASLFPAALFTARHLFAFETDLIATYDAVRTALVFDAYMMGFATFDQLRRSRERALEENLAMAQRNLALGQRLAVLDQSYEQLATRSRLREEDVMDAVHDLRQPMQALRLSMRQRFAAGAESRDSTQIETALSYMEQLVADRLAGQPGSVAAQPAPAAPPRPASQGEPGLHEVLRGVAEMFAPEAAAKGLTLTLRLAAPDGPVAAYPLMRALANLVSNAIKYTPHGRVLVALRRQGAGWCIEVHDTGPGLNPPAFEQARGRSQRLDRDRPVAEGSGLGLAIVQQIAAAQGWTLSAHSRRRTGATLRLRIPPVPVAA